MGRGIVVFQVIQALQNVALDMTSRKVRVILCDAWANSAGSLYGSFCYDVFNGSIYSLMDRSMFLSAVTCIFKQTVLTLFHTQKR